MKEDKVIKNVYFNRMDKKLVQYYFKEYSAIKAVTYDLHKPQFYDNKINLCNPLPIHKPYIEFDNSIKTKAKIFLDFMLEVLCNKDESVYNHLSKWIGNMCKGNKNDSAIVLRTTLKGVGKSTLSQMIIKQILGEKLSLESGSEPLKTKFNSILGGKLFVSFEELETFTLAEWIKKTNYIRYDYIGKKGSR